MIKRLEDFIGSPRAKGMGMYNKSELVRFILNRYLDEKVVVYDKSDSVKSFISEMEDKTHSILAYGDEEGLDEILVTFINRGLQKNQINILFISRSEEIQFIRALSKIENLDHMFSSEDILVFASDDCLSNGEYAAEPVLDKLRHMAQIAKQKSKKGFNIVGTLPGCLIEEGKVNEALRIENRFHQAIQLFDMPVTVLCLYKRLPAEYEQNFSRCHDIIIKKAK